MRNVDGDDDLDEFGLAFERSADGSPHSDALPDGLPRGHGLRADFMRPGLEVDVARLEAQTAHVPRSTPDISLVIEARIALKPDAWGQAGLPRFAGVSTCLSSFKPQKAVLTETLVYRFANGTTKKTLATNVADAGDLMLTQLYAGSVMALKQPPPGQMPIGIPGQALCAHTLGGGISYPSFRAGAPMRAEFVVEESVLYRASPPHGFTQSDLQEIEVRARLLFLGPPLR